MKKPTRMRSPKKKLPPLTPAEKALVDDLVKDGLAIQEKFHSEPLYKQTDEGRYGGGVVEKIRSRGPRLNQKPSSDRP